MKVALYHPWIYSKGGAERVVLEIAKRGRFSYDIYTHFYDAKNTFSDFKKLNVRVLGSKDLSGFLSKGFVLKDYILKKFEWVENYDALVVSTGGLAEMFVLRNYLRPSICFCHTPLRIIHDESYRKELLEDRNIAYKLLVDSLSRGYALIEKFAWRKFDFVFANSKNTKNRILKAGLVDKKKLDVLHPGVDTRKFKMGKKFEKYFLVPGRLTKYKRQLLAIRAFEIFSKKNKDFKLILVGSGEGDYANKIRSLVRKNDSIVLKENISDEELVEIYRNCYAVIFTAVNEDWGLIPLEANSCGKMVIAVNEGGPREYVKNGINGFLVKADANSLARKMKLLADNPDMVAKNSEVCRKIAERYDWSVFVEKLENKVKALAKEPF